ncbi:MAG: protein-glutamate O-methyltransferase CheR [Pseudomonadota bacterium]
MSLGRVAAVIARASGLAAAGERGEHLRRRVAGYVRTHGAAALESLLARAERGEAAAIEELRNQLAVNYTYFWREPEHFQILLEHLITQLRKKVSAGGTARPSLRLWSAGCASGEEAWSMAIVVAEARRIAGIDAEVEILATDIDTEALALARAASYREEVLQQLPDDLRARYLSPGGTAATRRWAVTDALRGMVRCARLDLLAAAWPECETGRRFDAIFCRNVMIYFSESARYHLFERFAALVRADGLLVLGQVEGGLDRAEPYFRPCGGSVYLPGKSARRSGDDEEHS